MHMHKLTGKYYILPHIFEDAFFRTSLAAEPLLLNTVVQIAECENWSSFLKNLLNIVNIVLLLRHLQKQQSYQQGERQRRRQKVGIEDSGRRSFMQRQVQSDRERETGEVDHANKFLFQAYLLHIVSKIV